MRPSVQVKPYKNKDNSATANPSEPYVPDYSSESESDDSVVDQIDESTVIQGDNASLTADDASSDSTIPYEYNTDNPDETDDDIVFQPVPQRETRQRRQPSHLQDYVCRIVSIGRSKVNLCT